MKFILLAVAFIVLVQPSVQLTCYECKSENYRSAFLDFNHDRFRKCDGDQKKWPTQNSSDVNFDRCKKIVEKIRINNAEETLVIRTIGIENMGLDEKIFKEYSCKEDLCNSGVTLSTTAFVAVLSTIVTLTTYHL